jgi:hypothetical protein
MKTHKLFANAFLSIVLSLNASALVFAQKTILPSGLTEKSTLAEILNWLDRTSLSEARIGLEANTNGPETYEVITTSTRYYEQAIFSKGFRFSKIDGCKLKLRNDKTELILFGTKYPNPKEGSLNEFRKTQNSHPQFTGEFSIPLQTLLANKAPFRHTKKAERAVLLGTWRVEFKLNSNLSLSSLFPVIWSKDKAKEKIEELKENAMRVEIINTARNKQNDLMYGDEITFTFDDKQMSENFYAAFGRAIALCKGK